MKGEKEFFKKRFFGGFNRNDVIKYIAKIAEERNEAIAAKEKAEKELQKLTEELKKLRGEDSVPEVDVSDAEELSEEEQPEKELPEKEQPDSEKEEDINVIPELRGTPPDPSKDAECTKDIADLDNDIAAIKEIGQIKGNTAMETAPIEQQPSAEPLAEPSATEEAKTITTRIKVKRRRV